MELAGRAKDVGYDDLNGGAIGDSLYAAIAVTDLDFQGKSKLLRGVQKIHHTAEPSEVFKRAQTSVFTCGNRGIVRSWKPELGTSRWFVILEMIASSDS